MIHKVNALASNSQDYFSKVAVSKLDSLSPLFPEDEHICPKCRLPYGNDCNGICFEPYWVRPNEVF